MLDAAAAFVGGLNAHARVPGGYAVVRSVATMQLEDVQPSYFLAETCKYLFLIADPGFLKAREHGSCGCPGGTSFMWAAVQVEVDAGSLHPASSFIAHTWQSNEHVSADRWLTHALSFGCNKLW